MRKAQYIQRRGTTDDKILPQCHPVLRRIYQARGISDAAELDLSLRHLPDFSLLKGMKAATKILQEAVQKGHRILIVGDFDADGATASAIAVRGLRQMGAAWVHYLVPNRFEYGYGLSVEIVECALAKKPDLIITVDNGIASVAGVARARKAGVKVIITDHHLPGDELPLAHAIVNPNQAGCPFPSKHLAGCGVMFYVLCALRVALRQCGWFQGALPEPNLAQLLDFVALGTIADVVPLDYYNRILVHQGLKRIQAGKGCPGIRALAQVAKRDWQTLTSADLGFALAPRLNAAGRLDDMSQGIELLLCDDERVTLYAQQLNELNTQRRAIEADMQTQALAALEKLPRFTTDTIPAGICLFHPDWHQGVVGIVASRIKEQHHRPVVIFAKDGESQLKGSARSIAGFHMRDALDSVDKQYPHLIQRFGGHAMAAGLTLQAQHFDAFCQAFEQVAENSLTQEQLTATLWSDGDLEDQHLVLSVAQLLQQAGPWGQSFPEPLFDGYFSIIQGRMLGEKHLKMQVQPQGSSITVDAIAFNSDPTLWPNTELKIAHLAYRLSVNQFRGITSLQLIVERFQWVQNV